MSTIGSDLASRRFLAQWGKEVFAAVGLLGLVAGLVDALFPDAFRDNGLLVALLIGITSILYASFKAWPRPIEHRYSTPNTMIRIVKGDLLDEPGHIVVGACDTFDTETPHIISRNSLQGQTLERLYGDDRHQFDSDLHAALEGVEPIAHVTKPGKTERFPVGTVAAVKQGGRRILFLAYTEMNSENVARGSSDGIWRSLLSLWEATSRYCNGEAVAVPVIGGGQARIAQILPAQDSVRFIAFSFMLASRREKVCDELRIVVLPKDYDRLHRLELQAFLDSLEPT